MEVPEYALVDVAEVVVPPLDDSGTGLVGNARAAYADGVTLEGDRDI